ncbi:hypothetical protein ABZX51_007426 [Aspergillus tubingensis]
MKGVFLTICFFVASTNAFILSPTCLSTLNKAIGKVDQYVEEAIAHVCHQGCALTVDTYHDTIRTNYFDPVMNSIYECYFTNRDGSEDEKEQILQVTDTLAEKILESCVPTGTAHPEQFDICKDSEVTTSCGSKIKTQIPAILWKHKSLLLSLTDNETCRRGAATIEDPDFWTLIEDKMDAFARSCPMRTHEK